MSPQTSSSSGLLSLPTEIKRIILSHLLVSEEPIMYHRSLTGSCWEIPEDISGNILFTCTAMLDLGADTVFRQNAFAFNSPAEIHAFLELPQTAIVQSIVLVIDDESSCAWYTYLQGTGIDPDLSYSRDFAHHTIRSVEVVLDQLFFPWTVSRIPGGTIMDVCNALIEQHLHHPTWTRHGMLRDFAVRGTGWSSISLILELDAALKYTILNRDVAAFEQFKLILPRWL